MSDDFKIPVNAKTLFGAIAESKDGSIESILIKTNAVIAINAYDRNQERIAELESHAVDMGKMAKDYVNKISILTHENALLENQLKNATAEISELKKKVRGY